MPIFVVKETGGQSSMAGSSDSELLSIFWPCSTTEKLFLNQPLIFNFILTWIRLKSFYYLAWTFETVAWCFQFYYVNVELKKFALEEHLRLQKVELLTHWVIKKQVERQVEFKTKKSKLRIN